MTNVRRFPRTLNEAFPGTAEYACAVEIPYKTKPRTWLRVIAASLILGFITMLVSSISKVLA